MQKHTQKQTKQLDRVKITVEVTHDLKRRLIDLANANRRSLTKEVGLWLEKAVG